MDDINEFFKRFPSLGIYRLTEDKQVVPITSFEEFCEYQSRPFRERVVGSDIVEGYHISTAFLYMPAPTLFGPIQFFETMIFNYRRSGQALDFQTRCVTYEEALQMHQDAILWLKARYIIPPTAMPGKRRLPRKLKKRMNKQPGHAPGTNHS